MSFGGLILTNEGRNKIAGAISENTALNFSYIKLGDGTFNGSYSSKTELTNEVMEIPITNVSRKGNEVIIDCDWNSKDAPSGFFLREIGIFGNGVLCYYDNAGSGDAEYIDPESEVLTKQKRLRFTVMISSEVEIVTQISTNLYVLTDDFNNFKEQTNKRLQVQELASETDLNSVLETGMYYCTYGKTYSNMPSSVSNGWLFVYRQTDNIVKQVFMRHGTAGTNDYQSFVRTLIGTEWSDWVRFVTEKDVASTTAYGVTKLSSATSSTSTSSAATPSAVKSAYDKAMAAYSGKGLPYAIFTMAEDITYTTWGQHSVHLSLLSSGKGDRASSFTHGGSFYIYCPYSGIVDIDCNWLVTDATANGYIYARCYKYNSSGDDVLLDFTGLGAVTSAGTQGAGSMKVHVDAGTYIYIAASSSVAAKSTASDSNRIRLQYAMID